MDGCWWPVLLFPVHCCGYLNGEAGGTQAALQRAKCSVNPDDAHTLRMFMFCRLEYRASKQLQGELQADKGKCDADLSSMAEPDLALAPAQDLLNIHVEGSVQSDEAWYLKP